MSRAVASGQSIYFPHHHPSNGHAAGVAVSHLFHGAARCHFVRLAWQVVMGFILLHGGSVCRQLLGRKPEIFQIQGGCQ